MDLRQLISESTVPCDIVPADIEPRLNAMPGIRAALFDVYGTLVSSAAGDIGCSREDQFEEAAQRALGRLGRTVTGETARLVAGHLIGAIQQQHARMKAVGISWPEVDIREMWSVALAASDVSGFDTDAIEQLAVAFEMYANPVWPMPGASEALGMFREAGFALGVISNAQFYTPVTLEVLFGKSLGELGFDPALCAWSWREHRAKPDPALFEKPLLELGARGILPAQTVYIGNDMLNDITPAVSRGCHAILFAGDQRSLRWRSGHPAVGNRQPDAVVTSWEQAVLCCL